MLIFLLDCITLEVWNTNAKITINTLQGLINNDLHLIGKHIP